MVIQVQKTKHHNKYPHLKILGIIILSSLYLEVILRLKNTPVFLNVGLLYILGYIIVLGFLITFIESLLPPKLAKFFVGFILFLITFIFISQMIYFAIFKNYYSIYSALNSAQALQFNDVIFDAFIKNWFTVILMILPFGLYVAFINKVEFATNSGLLMFRLTLVLVLLSLFLGQLYAVGLNKDKVGSDYQFYYHATSANKVVERFGLLAYIRIELRDSLFPNKAEVVVIDQPPVIIKPEIAYNILDIDFETLIKNETDESIVNMHKYFMALNPTEKNKMTGIYKDYNVIQITAEGFSHLAVDKDITPTLYKLANEGIVFNDFYNPIWNVSTSDGEYAHMTGLIPKNGVWSMREAADNFMPFVLGKQFSSLNYKTMAYHNHTYTYYDRHITYPSFGYDYKGLGSGLEVRETWPESDIEMMELSIKDYLNSDNFHAYYMTVSGHMRYTFADNFIASKNRDLVEHLDYNDNVKAYFATQIELDKALEYLLQQLKVNNVLDKTLIVMTSDHYPYGLDKTDIDHLAGHVVEETFELYRNAMIIYTPDMDNLVIDKPVSSLDVLATVSNLLGLDYDSRLLVGNDVFSSSPTLVIFNDQSFITDKGKYDANTQTFIANENVEVSEEYVQSMSKIVRDKFHFSKLILEKDYYSYVID